MPVSLLSEAEAAAPGARRTRTTTGLLPVSLLPKEIDNDKCWSCYIVVESVTNINYLKIVN